MKSNHRNTTTASRLLFAIFSLVLVWACLVAQTRTANAQTVFSSEPTKPAVPAAIKPTDSPLSEATPAPFSNPLQWGFVTLAPRITYRFLYGDGILSRPGRKSTTTLQSVAPGLELNLGSHWVLDSEATQTYYSNADFKDSFDYQFNLTGGAAYGNWLMQFTQNYISNSSTLVQTGQQTESTSYNTAFTNSYRFDTHFLWDTVLNQRVMLVEPPSPTTRNWFATERLNYRSSAQLNTNVGVDFGYVSITPGPDMTFIRPQAQIIWDPTKKFSLSVQGGFEKGKYLSGTGERLALPVYNAALIYSPFDYTKITFLAVRETIPSYIAGQLPNNTRWNIILDQRLLRRFYLHTGYSEEHYTYYSTSNSAVVVRADKGFLYNARLTTTVFRRVSLTGLYQFRKLKSSDPSFSFSGSYVGFEIGYRY